MAGMGEELPRGSVIAIRGGGAGHMMTAVTKMKKEEKLKNIKLIVCLIGGNDLGKRAEGGGAEVAMSMKEFEEHMKGLVRWLLEMLPGVTVRMLDLIARLSHEASFISAVRNWAGAVVCEEEGRHEHVSCWRLFVVENRNFRRKKQQQKMDEAMGRETREIDAAVNRFQLRDELFGGDGVHLNFQGKRILAELLKWQLLARNGGEGEELVFRTEYVSSNDKTVSLSAKFKF